MILGTPFLILGTRIGFLKHLKKALQILTTSEAEQR